MTISSTSSVISYNGDGTSSAFPFPYEFLDASHLVVNLVDIASGAVTPQAIGTNYTVSGAGNPAGGTVTMVVAPPSGSQLKIQRVVPLVQLIDLAAGDTFPAETMEGALDYLTMAVQQVSDLFSGASVPPSGGGTNTFLNLGAGHGVYLQTIGSQVQLRGLVAGSNVTITHNATDITIAAAGVAGALLAANNLSDVASRQTALNTLTNAAGGGAEFVLTRDTATGNAVWKVVPTGGGGEANTMSSSGAGSSIVQAKAGVNLPVRSFVAGANMSIVQNANDLTFAATTSGEVNTGQNIGVAGTGIFAGKSGFNLQFKGLAPGAGLLMGSNATDVTPSVNQAYPFVWAAPHKFLGAYAEPTFPPPAAFLTGVNQYAHKITRTAPNGGLGNVQSASLIHGVVPSASVQSFEWLQFILLENSASKTSGPGGASTENVGVYVKAHKKSTGFTWGSCIEMQDMSGNVNSSMFGLEIDICGKGDAIGGWRRGLAIYYGDAFPFTTVGNPNTTTGAGGAPADTAWPYTSSQGNAIEIAPFIGNDTSRNSLESAIAVGGRCRAAAINLSTLKETPIAIDIAGGSLIKFRGDNGGNAGYPGAPTATPPIPSRPAGIQTWYFGAFTPSWFGALAIMVDATIVYIPICNNHP